jgi:glutamyl-tRNA synthetase
MKALPPGELALESLPFLTRIGIISHDPDYLFRVVPTLSARCRTLVEMAEAARFYFQDPRPYEEKGAKKFLIPESVPILQEVAQRLEKLAEFSEAALNQLFHDLATETGLKMVSLAQPVRLALTGRTASPGLYEIINIIGKEETLVRITRAIEFAAATS